MDGVKTQVLDMDLFLRMYQREAVKEARKDILAKAVAKQGKPTDVESWARRLADDVSDLND
jgi:hypothetical protein